MLQWKAGEYWRKYAVGIKEFNWQPPANQSLLQYIALRPDLELTAVAGLATELFVGEPPVKHERQIFIDPTGQFVVRIWDTSACKCKPSAAHSHEWTHVLDGSITLTDADGATHHFSKGDTFAISHGTVYGWECPGFFRAIHSTLQPKSA
jgi:uncharacterized cupin superfamily protein